jgi:hypothetical protein
LFVVDRALEGSLDIQKVANAKDVQLVICKAYILAHKLGRFDIAGDVGVALIKYLSRIRVAPVDRIVCPRAVKLVYDNTTATTTLRINIVQVATDQYFASLCMSSSVLEKWLESVSSNSTFHLDGMKEIKQRIAGSRARGWDCHTSECILRH